MINLPAHLISDIRECGYYPDLIVDAVDSAVGTEEVVAHVVLPETAFDTDQVRRHLTVAVLTATRLIVSHTDDGPVEAEKRSTVALSTFDMVRLARVGTVGVTMRIADPENYTLGSLPAEVTIVAGWGSRSHLVVEPAACADPQCDADHGFFGTQEHDDFRVSVSLEAAGSHTMSEAVGFAKALAAAVR